MKKEMPMGLTSTHFLSYHDVNVRNEELIEDAFRLNCDFSDVKAFLREVSFDREDLVCEKLILKLRKHDC